MKILLTGGAGFIGSHIADAYVKAGHKVAIIDNFSTGRKANVHPKAKVHRADIRNAKKVEEIFRAERPDAANHHAALISVTASTRNPADTLITNVLGTENVLASFGRHGRGPRKFIFASTGGAIYGEPKKIPAPEDTPAMPLSPYGLSKKLCEDLIEYHARMAGFDFTILRYANVYGPRQSPYNEGGVVAIFAGLMKAGKRPVIFGDGSKTRDYVFVEDVARANALALARGKNVRVNIGRGKETSDKEVFEEVARAIGYSGKPKHAPYRRGEVNRICLDARAAKDALGWEPKTAFREGVERTVETFK